MDFVGWVKLVVFQGLGW